MNPIVQAFAELPNGFDELRIIAKDETRLTRQDRDTINRCADELEEYQEKLVAALQQLIETNSRYMALNDRMIEITKNQLTFPKISAQIAARM